jgi:hypothetical protein
MVKCLEEALLSKDMILSAEPLGTTALGMDISDEVVIFKPVSKPLGSARYIRPSTSVGSDMLWNDDTNILWNDDSEILWND